MSDPEADGRGGQAVLLVGVLFVAAAAGTAIWLNRSRPHEAVAMRATASGIEQARQPNPTPSAPDDPAPPSPEPPPTPEPVHEKTPETSPLEDVVGAALPAVVLIESSAGRGTGFFVAPDTLLTNVHVVVGSSFVTIRRSGGATSTARVASLASDFDIAVLKIANPASDQATIPLGSALTARPGQEVLAIGSPLGTLQNTVTRGIVSAVRESGGATLVQTDAAINPGNSGGPLIDRTGHAIGITTMGYIGRQGLGFAVAIDHARTLLEGKPVAATTARASSTELRGLSPAQPSPADQERAAAGQALDRTVAQLARRADNLDHNWASFKSVCYAGKVAGTFDHEWFAFFDMRAMQGTVIAGCDLPFADLRREAEAIRVAIAAADEAARRADVYPGDRRDALRKYRLDGLAR